MAKQRSTIIGCYLILLLSGCTTNTFIVTGQPQAGLVVLAAPSCWVPTDRAKNYKLPVATRPVQAVASDAAKNGRVSGCAAVAFQLGRDGKAKNVNVLREFPAGYGYAQAVTEAVVRATYQAPASDTDWYFTAIGIGFIGVAPVVPSPGAAPAKPPQRA